MNIDLNKVYNSDCLEFLKSLPDNSIDSIVTDPPAGIAFMNKDWDKDKGGKKEWMSWMQSVMEECLRVLKPGGHALIWAIPKTSHWTANAVEDAGFEIRNKVYHLFGTGFPKSLDIGKAVDKIELRLSDFDKFSHYISESVKNYQGSKRDLTNLFLSKNNNPTGCIWNWTNGKAVPTKNQYTILKSVLMLSDEFDDFINRIEKSREIVGKDGRSGNYSIFPHTVDKTWNISIGDSPWEGWGTDLKPAAEEWIMARKPLEKGLSVAANVLKWGTGGINIDGCRIDTREKNQSMPRRETSNTFGKISVNSHIDKYPASLGRFPANLILDDSEEIKEEFDKYGVSKTKRQYKPSMCAEDANTWGGTFQRNRGERGHTDEGTVARFFYCAKASVDDREENLDGFEGKMLDTGREGRFPANLILDDSKEIKEEFDKYAITKSGKVKGKKEAYQSNSMFFNGLTTENNQHGDQGSVARFFYCAKASVEDREEGLDGFEGKMLDTGREEGSIDGSNPRNRGAQTKRANHHPTVKNTSLMMYLCRLITPIDGIVLDPFSGSGSTGKAAILEGFSFVGCELDPEYVEIANTRIQYAISNKERLIKKYSTSVDNILPKKESISNKPEQTTEFF